MSTYTDPTIGVTLTMSEGIIYPITECCGASGKGSMGSETGVVCRACYEDQDSIYGMGWLVADFHKGWKSWSRHDPDAVLAGLGVRLRPSK